MGTPAGEGTGMGGAQGATGGSTGSGGSSGATGMGGRGGGGGATATGGSGGAATGTGGAPSCGASTLNESPFGCKFAWGRNTGGNLSSYSYLQFLSMWIGSEIKMDG